MDTTTAISASVSSADNCFCIDDTVVKMEPRGEGSVIVIKQEMNSDDENETNDDGEYYGYIDTSVLEEMNDSLISGTINHSEENEELSSETSDTTQYVMICENVEDTSGVLHLRLLNRKPLNRSFKTVNKSVEQNTQMKLQTKARVKKNLIMSSRVEPDAERPYKCSECEETFEVRSHLVMHELGHEKYKKYKMVRTIKQDPILHICKDCGATFEQKSQMLLHQVYHESDQNSNCICRKSLRTTSDLCRCFVRECKSCHRKFFAAIKLGNWTACIKCFFLKDSNSKYMEGSKEIDHYENVKTIETKAKLNETVGITSVKKLCYSCGKMCSNVISSGISWLCYDCWNDKLKNKGIKRIKQRYPEISKQLKYKKTDCVYCLQLFPYKSLRQDHKCLHKSVYLNHGKEFSQTRIENNDYTEDEIGQHFLLSSVDDSLESSILTENVIHSKYAQKTPFIPSKQFKLLSSNSDVASSKQLDESESDSDNDSACEEDQVIEDVEEEEVVQDDENSSIILCDKTGELITLSSETAPSKLSENNNSVQ